MLRGVVGLGNPGPRFADTRHNVGFMVLRILAERHGGVFRRPLLAPYRRARIDIPPAGSRVESTGNSVVLIEPSTFMNRSGRAVRSIRRRMGLIPQEILVICDTLDLPPGRVRLRPGGSSAGHNGLKSIIRELGDDDFPRLYIGVGRPQHRSDVVEFVLDRFSPDEWPVIEGALRAAADAVEALSRAPLEGVMNGVNSRR